MSMVSNRTQEVRQQGGLLPTTVRNANRELQSGMSALERMAVFISDRVGTPGFFLIIAVWTAGWVAWNVYAPEVYRFDRGMEFAVWIFVANAIQLALMPLLLIAQNLQSRHDAIRAENDYRMVQESKQEIEVVLAHLYMLTEDVKAIMAHMGVNADAIRQKDGIPDLMEEQFANRQQQLLDEMALKLAMTHDQAVERAKLISDRMGNQP